MDDNMEYSFVNNNSKWLADIISMGDEFRSTVGFLPRQAFEDYAKKGHIFAATENGCLLGYIMFRYKGHSLIVVHLCVDSKYRMRGIAKSLVNELFVREKPYISQMQLSCRRDYGISDFWSSCGFVPVGECDGRAINEKTTLTKWIRTNVDYPNIFELSEGDSRIKVVLDTNRIPALSQGDIVILYESSPIQRITAYCVIDSVVALSPAEMWSTYSCVLGINKEDYDSYFLSASCAYGLCLKNVVEFSHPIKLNDSLGILRPPQSYRYLEEADFTTLCKIGI